MIIPSPFSNKSIPLKAFVLGCDPTAFKDTIQVPLKTVFGIGQDGRYFAGIKANLKQLNIEMDDIYVKKLIPEYRLHESSKDSAGWINEAQQYIPQRVIGFDNIDPSRTIPVFITSELLYKALLNEGQTPKKPIDIQQQDKVIIPTTINKLCRPFVILYRHPHYSFKKQKDDKALLLKQVSEK